MQEDVQGFNKSLGGAGAPKDDLDFILATQLDPLQQRLVKSSIKTLESATKKQTEARLQQGEDPKTILANLLGTLGSQSPTPEDLYTQANSLAQKKVEKPGTITGLIPALFQSMQGKGFHPLQPQKQALGFENAMNLMQEQRQQYGSQFQKVQETRLTAQGLADLDQKDKTAVMEREMEDRRQKQEARRAYTESQRLSFDRSKEKRLDRQARFNYIKNQGGVLKGKDIDVIPEEYGTDAEALVAEGRAERILQEGKPALRIKSDGRFNALIQQGRILPAEEEDLSTGIAVDDSFNSIVEDMNKLGIKSPEEIGNYFQVQYEQVKNPFFAEIGPLSIPAKFKVARQLSGDPKRMAQLDNISAKLERTFQLYRKKITGSQAGLQELKALRELFPSLKNRPEALFSLMSGIKDENARQIGIKLDSMEAVGRDVGKYRDLINKRGVGSQSQPMVSPRSAQSINTGFENLSNEELDMRIQELMGRQNGS